MKLRPVVLWSKSTQVGRNPAFEHMGKTRSLLNRVVGAQELVGQVLCLPGGQNIRVLGLDVIIPDNEHTYAGAVSYGCAADSDFMNRRLRTAGRFNHVALADATAVARPHNPHNLRPRPPQPFQPPLSRQQAAAQRFGSMEKNWNGTGSLLEGYGLINKSITPVNNSAFQVAQRVNRIAGRKVIVPSHLASRAAGAVRAVAPASLAQMVGKISKAAGPAGQLLTLANIAIEIKNGDVDAHTYVNGAMLLVSVAGLAFASTAAAPILVAAGTVIAIYGVADFAFDIGEGIIDPAIGKKSGLWD